MRVLLIFLVPLFLTGFSNVETEKPFQPASCEGCDFTVRGYHFDGAKFRVRPGQVICFNAAYPYKAVRISNVKGTPEAPVIIRNCGGVAHITEGLRILQSQYFRLLGDGDPRHTFGIKVSIPKSFFITFEMFTSDFEAAFIEIAGYEKNGIGENAGFAGMGVKTSPYQDCALFSDRTRKAWVMKNVSIHDNYIHDVGGEGLYIGHGFYDGRVEKNCPDSTFSHSIVGLRVHHNLIENTGYDGIQVKNADEDCEIYNNVIRNFGTQNHGAHNEGLLIGGGVTGKVYNNLIDTGTGHGIMFQGRGNNDIFNNIILNAGEDGFNATASPAESRMENGYFRIFNNTIINSGDDGIAFFNDSGGVKMVMNNLVINVGSKFNPKGARLQLSNNIFVQDTLITFEKVRMGTWSMKRYLPAIDNGIDVRMFNSSLCFDFYNEARPRGSGFDIGAIEFE